MKIGPDSLWKAVIRCDERYDGFFYYAVKTRGFSAAPPADPRRPNGKTWSSFSAGKRRFERDTNPANGVVPICKHPPTPPTGNGFRK